MSEDVDCSQVTVIPFIDKQSRELVLFITFLPLILYHLFGWARGSTTSCIDGLIDLKVFAWEEDFPVVVPASNKTTVVRLLSLTFLVQDRETVTVTGNSPSNKTSIQSLKRGKPTKKNR
jgi:hypothetical protein